MASMWTLGLFTAAGALAGEGSGSTAVPPAGPTEHGAPITGPTDEERIQALREALAQGARGAVVTLGRTDGFWGSERFRIPLPKPLAKADSLLRERGRGSELEDLHLLINRAAEQAVANAAEMFAAAVRELPIAAPRGLLDDAPDGATRHFRKSAGDALALQFKPLVARVTRASGLAQKYDEVLASAGPLAALARHKGDVNDYVARKALDRVFLRMADEERAIRSDPAALGSAVMKKVFGSP